MVEYVLKNEHGVKNLIIYLDLFSNFSHKILFFYTIMKEKLHNYIFLLLIHGETKNQPTTTTGGKSILPIISGWWKRFNCHNNDHLATNARICI